MKLERADNEPNETVNVNAYEDISPLARRAGIALPTLVAPELRAAFETLVPSPEDGTPHEPLFHLLVPLRFVAAIKRSACRFKLLVGKQRLCEQGIAVQVDFCRDDVRGYFFAISSAAAD